jgi:hypothetical protein
MTISTFRLNFAGSSRPELYETEFNYTLETTVYKSIRGKTSGAYKNFGTFQWSSAVRAVSAIMLEQKIAHLLGNSPTPLIGEDGSLASSLDYALSKETNWLSEMFGCDASGRLLAKRLFHRTNSNRKRPGPVALAINEKMLPPEGIRIELGNIGLNTIAELVSLRRVLDRGVEASDQVPNSGIALAA